MWMLTTLCNMANRYLPENESGRGQLFAQVLLAYFAECFYISDYDDDDDEDSSDVPIDLKLGVVDKFYMFLRKAEAEDVSISLPMFAKALFGFLIAYTKYTEENAIWLSDFADLLRSYRLYAILDIRQTEESILKGMLDDMADAGITFENLSTEQLANMAERARMHHLKELEMLTLQRLDMSLDLNFRNLQLLLIQPWNKTARAPFLEECSSLTFDDPGMDKLITAVSVVTTRKHGRIFPAPASRLEGILNDFETPSRPLS